ncbi:uncharacterized protein TRUGW13939_07709 [Talaromyces rugulosus]|uniref:Transcription factor domain-containing protein n=1 Tax=Talaromyces rugulosus TaxID=121627 RepID=A0A7H8R2F4_TALRU|nr:uncharacterized protein TRUGW13939_07709 [Talaromyces rugulosus]QKX60564.1 hypothetical protein TRUGW13939_07709 [Talaromyces rugulosus]
MASRLPQTSGPRKHNPGGDLVFVSLSHPGEIKNRDNQRAIRSRVMRDIGRSRRTRKKRPQQMTFELTKTAIVDDTASATYAPHIPASLESWPFPVELDSRAKELVSFMNSEADVVYRPFRTIWFSMALVDQSAFQLSMANASMFLAQRKDPDGFRYETCSESLTYFGQCLSLVTKRLEDPKDRLSEGVITTILGLICHDLYVGIWDRLAAHSAGLHLIYKLRGGFRDLSPNIPLFASWYDILKCTMNDKPPSFPNYALDYTPSLVYHKRPLLEAVIQQLQTPDLKCVAEALERLALVAHFANKVSRSGSQWQKEDDMTPLYLVGSATHILLSMPRLNPSNKNISSVELLRELTRLAMLILLANLKRAYHFTSNEPCFLEAKLSDLLLTYPNTFGDVLPHLQLWAVMTVATLQPKSASQGLYTTRIASLMSLLGIKSAKAAFGMAKNIIWIESIAGEELNQFFIHTIDGIPS